jgi:hypothetical protein
MREKKMTERHHLWPASGGLVTFYATNLTQTCAIILDGYAVPRKEFAWTSRLA